MKNIWGVRSMSDEKDIFELKDELNDLGEIISKCIDKGEMHNKLVANWVFDTLQLLGKMGNLVKNWKIE